MSKELSGKARGYLRRLQNPCAADDVAESDVSTLPSDLEEPGEVQRRRRNHEVWITQDPYASLHESGEKGEKETARLSVVRSCRKSDFRAGCTDIFLQYVPPLEKGRLREVHRDFIERNLDQPSEVRFSLLSELRKYDLSSTRGLRPLFNRGKDALTDEKLFELEKMVLKRHPPK